MLFLHNLVTVWLRLGGWKTPHGSDHWKGSFMGKHVAFEVPADVQVAISTEELGLETRGEAWSGNQIWDFLPVDGT